MDGLDGWMGGWMDGRTEGWKDGWMDGFYTLYFSHHLIKQLGGLAIHTFNLHVLWDVVFDPRMGSHFSINLNKKNSSWMTFKK